MGITKKNHPVDERLPINQLFLYGLQHVLAMYAGAVAVPLILANALGLGKEQLIYLINADLFTCGIAMFGMVMASGIKTLSKIDFDNNHNLMVVAVSVAVGLIPLAVPSIYQKFPEALQVILNSGITVGSVVAIVLNAILNKIDTVPYATNNKRAN
ncbi:solute carrier family 23 protein [Pelosinus sp. IPA-1]|uniref:solute carrier family 23 protein n=1 Tax=Pelosinus sp. IPA-1 TaxID=3029569 RepID=UPI00243622C7|nr:solute carrier family 23 protein [Pelosinus sp. IPA-1]GMA97305.1 hypothetical protein PIPA1_01050 [Pelosinus sp. IPA-1]